MPELLSLHIEAGLALPAGLEADWFSPTKSGLRFRRNFPCIRAREIVPRIRTEESRDASFTSWEKNRRRACVAETFHVEQLSFRTVRHDG